MDTRRYNTWQICVRDSLSGELVPMEKGVVRRPVLEDSRDIVEWLVGQCDYPTNIVLKKVG